MDQQIIPASPTNNVPPTSAPTSAKSIVALILGILSLTCCGFFSGIPSIILGKSELNAIQEGRSPAHNKTLANIGMILGIIGTSLSIVGAVIYIILVAAISFAKP